MSYVLPNVRKIFIPDKGYTIFDADLKGADAQVVAWEAEDKELKQWLTDGTDMHVQHCIHVGEQPEILSLKGHAYDSLRQSYKHAVHATHYGASAFAISAHPAIGWPKPKAERFLARYFQRRPGIKRWHDRVATDLKLKRTISNRFGYRIIYFDREDKLLPQALAWVPQSTVALVCFKGALRLRKALPWVEILLQVHDNLVFQVPNHRAEGHDLFRHHLSVEVPYPEPLVIPWGLAKSEKSWGDCQKI